MPESRKSLATRGFFTSMPEQVTSGSLSQFFDISPDALVILNETGTIVMANKQAEALLGYAHEEITGQSIEILLPQRFREAHIAYRKSYFSTPLTRPMGAGLSLFGLRKDGTEFPVDISLRPLLLDGILHAIAAICDITEQKRLEEQLQRKNEELEVQYHRVQEANRLKSEFLANMSHELRTPLNGIIGFAELIHDEEAGPVSPEQKKYLGDILLSARHLLQLIRDVLDLAKVEAGKMTFLPESTNLTRLVDEVRDILRPLVAAKRISFHTYIDPSLGEVIIDPSRFKQVLYNYLSNAIKFSPEQGQISINIRAEGEQSFTLEVSDTGPGIQPEDIGRLFVEFQQLDAGTAKEYQGTGLGLALTRRVIVAQGGSVGVRSTPGQGSTFFATLPRVNATLEQKSVESWRLPGFPLQGAPTILVVDDETSDRSRLVSMLIAAGCAIETASTARAASQRCQERAFDMITLDLLLPDASGWDVLYKIRACELNRDTPVIVISQVKESQAIQGFPIQGILSKPVQLEQLLATLKRAMRTSVTITEGQSGQVTQTRSST